MNFFKFSYYEACENLKLKPSKKVIRKIDESLESNSLNLSAVELDENCCKAFEYALSKDVHLCELDLSNCMLDNDGLFSILSGLEKNTCLKTLNLKGNNIKNLGAEAIGKFLRHNSILENLYLEWNGIGIFPEKFAHFCEGLGFNASLKTLDLKNNQLNHICGQLLSVALCRNSSLQRLDLRWNCIGLLGGRELSKALAKNKNLIKVEVSGNDIPIEVQESIESLAVSAAEKFLLKNESLEMRKLFSSRLLELEVEKEQKFKILFEQLDRKDSEMKLNERRNSSKFMDLQESLSERDSIIDSLKKRYKDVERKLNVVSEEKNKLALELNEVETKFKEKKEECLHLVKKEKLEKDKIERKLLEEIGSLKEENTFMKKQVQDLKTLNANLSDKVMKLENTIKIFENSIIMNEAFFHDQKIVMIEKHQREIYEIHEMKKNDIDSMRNEFLEVENILKDKLSLLQSQNCNLQKSLAEKEQQLMTKQIQEDENIENLKRKMKQEEERLKTQMEDKIHILESANQKQEEQLKEQLHVMHDIKKMVTENDLLLAEEAHRIQLLQKELKAKDAEIKTAVANVKLEVKEQLEELVQVKKLLTESEVEKDNLQKEITALQKKFEEEKEQNANIVNTLSAKVQQLKLSVKTIKDEQDKRNDQLKLALISYLNPTQNEVNVHLSDTDVTKNE